TLQDSNDSARKEKNIEPKTRKKRKIGREPLYVRWDTTKPISYEFADSIPQSTRHKIREAIALWELRTCVRFLENGPSVDRIEFFDGGGCSSFVGKTGGTQVFAKRC
uniref:Peptidase M12A domain-containing protein n=1 Tax=Parascaris univalens TaxID=6257 RepID=A0A915C844_PARUN